jgi:hypothetical protein
MMLWRTIDAGLADMRQVDSCGNLITRCPIDRVIRAPAVAAPQLNLAFVSFGRVSKSEYDVQELVRSDRAIEVFCLFPASGARLRTIVALLPRSDARN